VIANLQTHES